jgi:hypothetical protein
MVVLVQVFILSELGDCTWPCHLETPNPQRQWIRAGSLTQIWPSRVLLLFPKHRDVVRLTQNMGTTGVSLRTSIVGIPLILSLPI